MFFQLQNKHTVITSHLHNSRHCISFNLRTHPSLLLLFAGCVGRQGSRRGNLQLQSQDFLRKYRQEGIPNNGQMLLFFCVSQMHLPRTLFKKTTKKTLQPLSNEANKTPHPQKQQILVLTPESMIRASVTSTENL